MAYAADFYIQENIIGYTGDSQNKPTVYFRSGHKFGRITQAYPDSNYQGRSLVREYTDYSISNRPPKGTAEEYYNGEVRHCSRYPFIPVDDNDSLKAVLAIAIASYPYKKPIYSK
ncbi:hypothetical protein [Agarilytica rhodophyticola]|uniref:hypothetical protein n=1 Tax=Agarilytica rhodophyticola TaxID=1737490 RepID=UPI000B348086|nr:hypothetical protein [Agarilytica rhodophyticola]